MSDLDFPLSDLFKDLGEIFSTLAIGFNNFCSYILRNGNVVLFIIFLIMGLSLLYNAKEKEDHQRIYARNLEYIKKKGRAGSIICILIAIGFLSKGLLVFLDWCFASLPTPIFFSIAPFESFYVAATSIEAISSFTLVDSFLYFLFSLFSLMSIVVIAFGVYLVFFNKRILRTKFKSFKVLLGGILLAVIYGIPTSIRLMI